MICADPRFDPRDPPETAGPAEPRICCCAVPSLNDEDERHVYCMGCEAEWVPKAHLDGAKQLYVELATRGVAPAALERAKAEAARVFDKAIAAHAEATYHDPDRDFDGGGEDEP